MGALSLRIPMVKVFQRLVQGEATDRPSRFIKQASRKVGFGSLAPSHHEYQEQAKTKQERKKTPLK